MVYDWPPNVIRAELLRRGTNLNRLSRATGLHRATLRDALRRPYPRAEKIIADAIGIPPKTIWPSRYHPDGTHRGGRSKVQNSAPRPAAPVEKRARV